MTAGAAAFGVAAGLAAGVAAGAAGFVVADEFAAKLLLPPDKFDTEPEFDSVDGLVVGVATGAGRAPLNSFGLSTTFFARKFSIRASFIAIA